MTFRRFSHFSTHHSKTQPLLQALSTYNFVLFVHFFSYIDGNNITDFRTSTIPK
ncbi:hypothetical protein EDO6_05575 [Paenibacillus xylanexedens]|nr:hypothetical protein EDO6_05575 [Paenibacillus xylanexedens]